MTEPVDTNRAEQAETSPAEATDTPHTEASAVDAQAASATTPDDPATDADAPAAPSVSATENAPSDGVEPAPEAAPDAVVPEAAAAAVAAGEAEPADGEPVDEVPAVEGAEAAEAAGAAEGGAATAKGAAPAPDEAAEEVPIPPEFQHFVDAMENGTPLDGKVIGWNKGGFHVSLDGVPGFCPRSQIELGNPKRPNSYVDRTFPFKITEVKEGGKRIVVSRSSLLVVAREEAMNKVKAAQKSGEAIDGTVTSTTDFGAFVDVGGGVEGLVHLSALSRRRVENAREIVHPGMPVKVKVTKIEKGGQRISLSMKALEPDPWTGIEDRFPVGSKHTGKILRKTDFGFFVEAEPGVDGLVHESQLPIGMRADDDALAEGKEIEFWVREADARRHRLSLAMREVAATNPWKDIGKRYEEGQTIKGTVEQTARFGVFIMLEPGLTGLLPFAVLSLPTGANPQRSYRPGSEVEVQIAEIDSKRKRISLVPPGSQLEGTKSDLKAYRDRAAKEPEAQGMGALAAAFAKISGD